MGVGASRAFTGPANRPDTWKALIDTGAEMTAISPSVVRCSILSRSEACPSAAPVA